MKPSWTASMVVRCLEPLETWQGCLSKGEQLRERMRLRSGQVTLDDSRRNVRLHELRMTLTLTAEIDHVAMLIRDLVNKATRCEGIRYVLADLTTSDDVAERFTAQMGPQFDETAARLQLPRTPVGGRVRKFVARRSLRQAAATPQCGRELNQFGPIALKLLDESLNRHDPRLCAGMLFLGRFW